MGVYLSVRVLKSGDNYNKGKYFVLGQVEIKQDVE